MPHTPMSSRRRPGPILSRRLAKIGVKTFLRYTRLRSSIDHAVSVPAGLRRDDSEEAAGPYLASGGGERSSTSPLAPSSRSMP